MPRKANTPIVYGETVLKRSAKAIRNALGSGDLMERVAAAQRIRNGLAPDRLQEISGNVRIPHSRLLSETTRYADALNVVARERGARSYRDWLQESRSGGPERRHSNPILTDLGQRAVRRNQLRACRAARPVGSARLAVGAAAFESRRQSILGDLHLDTLHDPELIEELRKLELPVEEQLDIYLLRAAQDPEYAWYSTITSIDIELMIRRTWHPDPAAPHRTLQLLSIIQIEAFTPLAGVQVIRYLIARRPFDGLLAGSVLNRAAAAALCRAGWTSVKADLRPDPSPLADSFLLRWGVDRTDVALNAGNRE